MDHPPEIIFDIGGSARRLGIKARADRGPRRCLPCPCSIFLDFEALARPA
jgi:hypothetical protein